MLCHKIILTWDNLRKKKFHGPFRYPNYKQNEETIQHLMDSCYLVKKTFGKKQILDVKKMAELKKTLPKQSTTGLKNRTKVIVLILYGESF